MSQSTPIHRTSDYRMLVYGAVLVVMMLAKVTDWKSMKRALSKMLDFRLSKEERA